MIKIPRYLSPPFVCLFLLFGLYFPFYFIWNSLFLLLFPLTVSRNFQSSYFSFLLPCLPSTFAPAIATVNSFPIRRSIHTKQKQIGAWFAVMVGVYLKPVLSAVNSASATPRTRCKRIFSVAIGARWCWAASSATDRSVHWLTAFTTVSVLSAALEPKTTSPPSSALQVIINIKRDDRPIWCSSDIKAIGPFLLLHGRYRTLYSPSRLRPAPVSYISTVRLLLERVCMYYS